MELLDFAQTATELVATGCMWLHHRLQPVGNDRNQLWNFWILLRLQLNLWQLVACGCIIGYNQLATGFYEDWLHTLKITKFCVHIKNPYFVQLKCLFEMHQTRGCESFLKILSMHIENSCFVHFKDPLEMCKTRGCTMVGHQP